MKKLISILAIVLVGSLAHAGLIDQLVLTSGNMATATYNVAASGDLSGIIGSVKVYVSPAGATTDVNVVNSNGETIFAKSGVAAGTSIYPILVPAYSTAGAALSFVGGGATNDTVNTVYKPLSIAGTIAATWTNVAVVSGACTSTVTITFQKQQ